MLIGEKLQTGDFSPSEQTVIAYILEQKLGLQTMTTKEIAQATFTSPSTLIRIAHKSGYKGWNELKAALIKEEEYLSTCKCGIDANYPFQKEEEGSNG